MKRNLLLPIFIFSAICLVTIGVIFYTRGYRFGFTGGKPAVAGTGVLAATSVPTGASVFINNNLTSATNDAINLPPGEYTVKIHKEGYLPWEKKLTVQKEVVTKADALLFPTAPKLEPITANGVTNPMLDPSQTRIAYMVASESARKNGIYILDMSNRPILTLQSAAVQIVDDTTDLFSDASLQWSPDGEGLLATIRDEKGIEKHYLLRTNGFNETPRNITATLSLVKQEWEEQKAAKDQVRLAALSKQLRSMITNNFTILAWSSDETKILYQASTSATLQLIIKPRLIGIDTNHDQRVIDEEKLYVYDIKEDVNYKILDSLPTECSAETAAYCHLPINWFPDSKHLIFVQDKKIAIMQADASNLTTIYAGPFVDNYVFPWPNGTKIVILTNLNHPNLSPSLYTISLK